MFSFRKAWSIFDYNQKKYIIFIFILMFVSMLLETLSIGIILPLLSIFLKNEIDSSIFSYLFIFGQPTEKNLIFVGLSVTLVIFLTKNLFLTFNHWQNTKFLEKTNLEISNKLFKSYLKRDYIFFIKTNTAQLYRNVTAEIASFIEYINRYIIFSSEIIIFFGIAALLLYLDFLGTMIILFLVSVSSFVIYTLTKKKIDIYAKERISVAGELNKHVMQGFFSAKDVKILDREENLIHQVYINLVKNAEIGVFMKFIGGLPKFLFEFLVVCVFIVLVLSMIYLERNPLDIIMYLGVFAVASFRIIPGASRIFISLQEIKFRRTSVNLLSNELNAKDNSYVKKNTQQKNFNQPIKFQRQINVKNLCFSYPTRKEFSLSEISMNIKKGESIGIIGETGSGKSTLINLFIGLLKPSKGKVEVDELNILSNLSGWYKKIGYVPQSIYLMDDTIKKNIAFGLRDDDIDDVLIKKAVEKASLNTLLNNLPNGLETIVGERGIGLSGGQQQRIGIARALYRDPEILILDEATSSLDNTTEKKIMDSIELLKRKITLLIVTHRLSTVNKCDKIFFIDKGKITKQGSPKEILQEL